MDDPVEKKFFMFTFNKRDRNGASVNIALDVPGSNQEDAAASLRAILASMIADLNEKYPKYPPAPGKPDRNTKRLEGGE